MLFIYDAGVIRLVDSTPYGKSTLKIQSQFIHSERIEIIIVYAISQDPYQLNRILTAFLESAWPRHLGKVIISHCRLFGC